MGEAERSDGKQLTLLESRIAEASAIIETVESEFASVDGATKLKNRIKAELKFLTDVKVVSRSARGLAVEYVGAGGGTSRSISEQAQDYVDNLILDVKH
ncbi:unnamed protein product [Toxocara canis]|uniref:Flagellin_D0/D1 domain-containing protein n=1 Tax=Toxocara canis TaxID=6265 RepID=A0A183V280_TOXCA|nr:unnamed protein product [Toxocara canis]